MTVTWLIGHLDEPEAASISDLLAKSLPAAETYRFRSPGEAIASGSPAADLVIVVQRRPAEFSRRDSETLIGGQPLARFVVGLGPWCASHGRSERLWPEAVSVPLDRMLARLRCEIAGLAGSEMHLPITAGRDDRILSEAAHRPRMEADLTVAVISSDRHLKSMLEDALRETGASLDDPSDAGVVLIDVDPLGGDSLRAVPARYRPDARLVALTALPTAKDVELLRRSGFQAVLSKPCGIAELVAALSS